MVLGTALTVASLIASAPAIDAHQDQSNDPIVVTAPLPEEARKQAQAYLREVGVASRDRPAARWFDPVCPRVVGLSQEHGTLVERQIRRTAEMVGAPLAKEGCASNFVVIFTEDADSLVRLVAKRQPTRLTGVDAAPQRDLLESEAPVRWWYKTNVITTAGLPESGDHTPSASFTQIGSVGFIPQSSSMTITSHNNSSFVSTQTVRAIYAATVVIDVNRASGTRLNSVTDFATLVGLAEVGRNSAPAGSILSVFEPGASDQALSDRDQAFLSGLYRIPMDRKVQAHRSLLVREMVRKSSQRAN